jgi:hypothetical protein
MLSMQQEALTWERYLHVQVSSRNQNKCSMHFHLITFSLLILSPIGYIDLTMHFFFLLGLCSLQKKYPDLLMLIEFCISICGVIFLS